MCALCIDFVDGNDDHDEKSENHCNINVYSNYDDMDRISILKANLLSIAKSSGRYP